MSLLSDLAAFTNPKGQNEEEKRINKESCFGSLLRKYNSKNYYEIFGLEIKAPDKSELNTQWKSILLIVHPDKAKGKVYEDAAEALTKLVVRAYETLSDDQKEKVYRAQQPKSSPSQGAANSQGTPPQSSQPNGPAFFERSQQPYSSTSTSSTKTSNQNNNNNNNNNYGTRTNTFYSSDGQQHQVYTRDIQQGETISAQNEDITIHGHVYGTVKNQNGKIYVNGKVCGRVTNQNGDTYVSGNVSGAIKNTNGKNYVFGDVSGIMDNTNGNNEVRGRVLESGSIRTVFGSNIINGQSEPKFFAGNSQTYRF
jgi:curved DNA-binding protein CbpA